MRAFNWAVKRGRLGKNPITGIEIPPQRRILSYLTAEQRKAVFAATNDMAFKRFLTALQETGCRPGEISSVTAANVDLEAGVWVLPKHKTGKKTGKPRTVFLNDTMLALTKELVAAPSVRAATRTRRREDRSVNGFGKPHQVLTRLPAERRKEPPAGFRSRPREQGLHPRPD